MDAAKLHALPNGPTAVERIADGMRDARHGRPRAAFDAPYLSGYLRGVRLRGSVPDAPAELPAASSFFAA